MAGGAGEEGLGVGRGYKRGAGGGFDLRGVEVGGKGEGRGLGWEFGRKRLIGEVGGGGGERGMRGGEVVLGFRG